MTRALGRRLGHKRPAPSDRRPEPVERTYDCTHCHGVGYHGNGTLFDEDTRAWIPQDCGCCAGRGFHRSEGRCFS